MKCPYCNRKIANKSFVCVYCDRVVNKTYLPFLEPYLPEDYTSQELDFLISQLRKFSPTFEGYIFYHAKSKGETDFLFDNCLQNASFFIFFIRELEKQNLDPELAKETYNSAIYALERGTIQEFIRHCPYAGELSSI